MKHIILVSILSIVCISIFQKCGYRKDFTILSKIKINENKKLAIIKNIKSELILVKFIGNQYETIRMKRDLQKTLIMN